MSKKHNTKHGRSASRYPERLAARGESPATVRMPFFRHGKRHDTAAMLHRPTGDLLG